MDSGSMSGGSNPSRCAYCVYWTVLRLGDIDGNPIIWCKIGKYGNTDTNRRKASHG